VLSDDDEADLRQALDDRMAALVETSRRRREDRRRTREEKNRRRTAGMEARHNRKLNRKETQ
jgi:hypothetical protein